jgi:hypothetical protein
VFRRVPRRKHRAMAPTTEPDSIDDHEVTR